MKFNKIDLLILILPIIIMVLLTPVLPDNVPIHWGINGAANGFINKRFAVLLGLIPFAVYKLLKQKYGNKQ